MVGWAVVLGVLEVWDRGGQTLRVTRNQRDAGALVPTPPSAPGDPASFQDPLAPGLHPLTVAPEAGV